MRRAVLAVALVLATTVVARAHDLRPGVVSLVEQDDTTYALRFQPPIDSRGEALDVRLELPAGCTRDGDRVHCTRGLAGTLGVAGMRGAAMKTIVVLERRDGAHHEWIVTADAPRIAIDGAPPRAAAPWLRIGLEHILGGPDHLAFVIGLLLVLRVGFDRRLFATITAFTLAHSVTLALAALGVVAVPIAPVEACIALSVLVIAREALHDEPTAIRRWPWLAATAFGLLHGLGFAAALGEIGLPRGALAWSLAWFNVGVELGQLAVVAIVVGGVAIWRRVSVGERRIVGARVHRTVAYLLGALAAWWLLDRLWNLASPG